MTDHEARRGRSHRPGWGRLRRSLGAATRGIAVALAQGRNLRLQVAAGAVVVGFAAWLRLDGVRWALLVGCVAAVLAAEVANSAVERLCDLVDDEHGLGLDPRIRDVKDLAAGAVLVTSVGAATTGLVVLGPALLALRP